jgi:hypothetical protein
MASGEWFARWLPGQFLFVEPPTFGIIAHCGAARTAISS